MKKILLICGFLFASSFSFAQKNPCEKDIENFCKEEAAKHGNIVQCLESHKDKLSAACKDQDAKMTKALKDIKPNCHADYQKFCTGPGVDNQGIVKCLKEHKGDLSAVCKKEMGL